MNDINFPAGVLQPPLYDPKLDDGPNYGDTGATIGHELTHGFDDEGRQFDAHGNLKNWWTKTDAQAFEKAARCVSDEYEVGSLVMYQAGTIAEALRAKAAGADVIVAQGTEGGGHVGWMASMVLLPMIVDAVGSTPMMAAGGIADGRGLAAALALGAQGALLGTRFLATKESPLHPNLKQAVLDSDGHDAMLTEIPDIARGNVWPGAMARSRRNAFIERRAGREWELRARQPEALAALQKASAAGDADNASLLIGQDAGLIRDIPAAGEIVERIAAEAEALPPPCCTRLNRELPNA
jgi:NAD(P)H-dependent flavin oxidoreductase YrpB (nitropropane dioxygenase family)